MEIKVPSTEVPIKDLKKVLPPYVLDSYIKRIKQVCDKEGCPRKCQESGFVLKNVLLDSGGKWMPIHNKRWQTCTSYEYRCSQEILCQKKNESSMSRKPEKAA
jgi:hypothetical protein